MSHLSLLLTLFFAVCTVSGDPRGICAIEDYGGVADGVTDNSKAFESALADCADHGGEVAFANGSYLFSNSVVFNQSVPSGLSIRGLGWGSVLLWAAAGDLFYYADPSPAAHVRISDLAVASVGAAKAPNDTAFRFSAGFVRSGFENVLFVGQDDNALALQAAAKKARAHFTLPLLPEGLSYTTLGSCIDMGIVSDTSSVRDTIIWFTLGTGIRIGHGSEIRIQGGRIIGACKYCNSTGIHVTGNNGGVHILMTDVISLHEGVVLDSSNGFGSNREIFITHATIDSNWRGLVVMDQSYISIAGLWAASSDQDNIWISPKSTDTIITIAGGTIFNAGAEGGDPKKGMCNGIVINAGRVTLNGVLIRSNKGKGLWAPSLLSDHLLVSGCQLFDNGQNINLLAKNYIIANSICTGNASANDFGPGRSSAVVANTIGC